MHKLFLGIRYRWAMANAYLTGHYAPLMAAHWLTEADMLRMELWRLERGMV